ncbi:unnamed protein product, partial [Rotaria magnacalcarata]
GNRINYGIYKVIEVLQHFVV